MDAGHLKEALEIGGPGVKGYKDFREVLERPDIDIVHIATPPHWHALISVAAAKAGKDIWCEKPMTRTIGEGRRVVEAVQRNGRIFRLNTWFRFEDGFYGFGTTVKPIKKVVAERPAGLAAQGDRERHHRLRLEVQLERQDRPAAPTRSRRSSITTSGSGPPRSSPTTRTAFTRPSAATGTMTAAGWATWACTTSIPSNIFWTKTATSPVEIEADCAPQHPDACGSWRRIRLRYADGCEIILDGENRDTDAPFIEGPEGKLLRGFRSDIPDIQEKLAALPDPEPQVTDFARGRPNAAEVRPERGERPPLLHPRQPGQDRRPAGPAAALRPGRTALYRRRRGQSADRPAHARAMEIMRNNHRSLLARPVLSILAVLMVLRLASSGAAAMADRTPLQLKVTNILGKYPARSAAEMDGLAAELLSLGREGVLEVCRRLAGPGKDANACPRLCHRRPVALFQPSRRRRKGKASYVGALFAALDKAPDADVKSLHHRPRCRSRGKAKPSSPSQDTSRTQDWASPRRGPF